MRAWLLLAALLPGAAVASEDEFALGVPAVILSNGGVYNSTVPRVGLEAAYAHGFESWRLGGGVRWFPQGQGSLPLELYARALLSPLRGVWRPAVGPELGLSGLPIVIAPAGGYPADLSNLQGGTLGPLYLSVHAEPLRFVFHSLSVSALELQWGTPLNQPGAALRLHLGLVQVGWTP